MFNWQPDVGIAAGILSLASYVPYIISIYRGKTRPNRATWWIWTTIGIILTTSYSAVGATHTLWVALSQLVSQIVIALLSLKYGEGGWRRLDRMCLAGVALSLLLWWRSGSPLVALLINIGMDGLGALPTLRKLYHDPDSEDALSWFMFLGANTLNLFAIERFSIELAIYPLYLFCLSLGIVALLTRSRRLLRSLQINPENRRTVSRFFRQIGGRWN